MVETYLRKFRKHCRAHGLFYAFYRGVKYIQWRRECKRRGIDWKQFGRS